MHLNSQSETLSTLLIGNKQYSVPNYQRNYSWQTDQVDTFLDDIIINAESNDTHFFGPVVLLKNQDFDFDHEIVDGQQRLTSVIILACLLRDKISTYQDKNILINGVAVSLDFFVSQLLWTGDMITPRFKTNYLISEVFEQYILAHPDSPNRKQLTAKGVGLSDSQKRSTRELRSAYFRMKSRIQSWVDGAGTDPDSQKLKIYQLVNTLLNSFELLAITVHSLDDAYILFETLNDRGLRLTPSDLIKSRTLQKIHIGPALMDVDTALTKWDLAVDMIGDYPFTKFLRHYLLTKQQTPVQARRLFAIVNQRIDELGAMGAEKNLKEICDAAEIYAKLLNTAHVTGKAKLDATLKRLNSISDTHRIFLLKVFSLDYSDDDLLKAARVTECLAFRWVLTGGNAQVLENIFQSHANLLTSPGDPNNLKDTLMSLLSNVPSDEKVNQEIRLSAASGTLQQYVLQRINFAITQVELPWDAQQINVEHLAPQKPEAGSNWLQVVAPHNPQSPEDDSYADFVAKWGNLTLLEDEINKSIKNKNWQIKVTGVANEVKGLMHSNIYITKSLTDISQWTSDHILARTEWMAESITKITSVSHAFNNDAVINAFDYDPG